jgi:hypothetical protein
MIPMLHCKLRHPTLLPSSSMMTSMESIGPRMCTIDSTSKRWSNGTSYRKSRTLPETGIITSSSNTGQGTHCLQVKDSITFARKGKWRKSIKWRKWKIWSSKS